MKVEPVKLKPKIIVFAGPNGSGKSTITSTTTICGTYINADIIQKEECLSCFDAAIKAEKLREEALSKKSDFTFETVLSTERNLDLLKRAKSLGYFIRGYYVLTCSPDINIERVKYRVSTGGHDVPKEKIRDRYYRALSLLPEFVNVCDICTIYDNSDAIEKIFKKHHGDEIYSNRFWSAIDICKLVYPKN